MELVEWLSYSSKQLVSLELHFSFCIQQEYKYDTSKLA